MRPAAERNILHVDMDAFFASVEQLDRPDLKGRPVLVGHDGPRGVVAAASYEARVFGCHSAQPMAVAKRLCPHAIVMPGRFWRYREISKRVFEIFDRFTPVVQPLSIDEAFLDLTGTQGVHGDAAAAARRIKDDVRRETGCTASVGVAGNKFLAKLASDMEKPDGLTVINAENLERLLPPLSIDRMWGVGPKTAEKLRGLGVKTFGDLRRIDGDVLVRRFGDDALRWQRLAFGEDDRPVTSDREAKSIGQEQTFGTNLDSPAALRAILLEQAEEVGARLRRHALQARGVSVKIRFGDFQTITRRCTLPSPTDSTAALYAAARDLFAAWARTSFQPVRLIGLTATGLGDGEKQLGLFPDPDVIRQKQVDRAMDAINSRFGANTIRRSAGGSADDR